jgi:hypothetical protein
MAWFDGAAITQMLQIGSATFTQALLSMLVAVELCIADYLAMVRCPGLLATSAWLGIKCAVCYPDASRCHHADYLVCAPYLVCHVVWS